MCTFAHGYVCFLVNCKDNQKRADTNTSASPNLLMGLQCLADSNNLLSEILSFEDFCVYLHRVLMDTRHCWLRFSVQLSILVSRM